MRFRYPYLPLWVFCAVMAVVVGLCLRRDPGEVPPKASEETLARLEAVGVPREDVAHYPETAMKQLAWILEGRNLRLYRAESPAGQEPAMELTVFVLLDREDPGRVDQLCCLGWCGWEPVLWRPKGRDLLVLGWPASFIAANMGEFALDMTPVSWAERIFGGPERTQSRSIARIQSKCDFLAHGQGFIQLGLSPKEPMTPIDVERILEDFHLQYTGQDGREISLTLEY